MSERHAATLREALREWTDFDGAEHALALCLGLMSPGISFATDAKHVYWTNNPVGNVLSEILQELTRVGILELNDDLQYRWNPSFRGTWEFPTA